MTDYQDRLRKLLPDGYYQLNQRGKRDVKTNSTESQKDDEERVLGNDMEPYRDEIRQYLVNRKYKSNDVAKS
jgi:hypothetical protein